MRWSEASKLESDPEFVKLIKGENSGGSIRGLEDVTKSKMITYIDVCNG